MSSLSKEAVSDGIGLQLSPYSFQIQSDGPSSISFRPKMCLLKPGLFPLVCREKHQEGRCLKSDLAVFSGGHLEALGSLEARAPH